MKFSNSKILSALAGCMVTWASGMPQAVADDSEVFTSGSFTSGSGVLPNVLFIIDTSGSMNALVNVYDPSRVYAGTCDANRIYWQVDGDETPPDCATEQYINPDANRCRAAYNGMAADGWWRRGVQQLRSDDSAWQNIVSGEHDKAVECSSDSRSHGDDPGSASATSNPRYARNGSGAGRANRWTTDGRDRNRVDWSSRQQVAMYSGNYANWFTSVGTGLATTRLDIVRTVAKNLITDLQGVNLGLMRYSNNQSTCPDANRNGRDDDGPCEVTAEGGMVTFPVSELTEDVKTAMKAELDAYGADGYTPLSETLYEAHQYLSGGSVEFGNSSKLDADTDSPSVRASRGADDNTYDSPMDFSCQKTFIVYLTDGLPTADNNADARIEGLPDFADDGGACPTNGPNSDWPTSGRCLANLAGYLHEHDLRDSVQGVQNVTTYVVGFGSDIAASATFLEEVATAGGGRAYTQTDAAGLTSALQDILTDVASQANSTFVSPTVAVNAFNRTRNLNSLFVSVFAPSTRMHWPGNVKKYQLIDGKIHGVDTLVPAVNPGTGFFTDGAKDLFSADADADGPDVTKGGAASRLPAYAIAGRNLYTYLGNAALTDATNAVQIANASLTATVLGRPTATSAERDELIEFIRGRDVRDDDDDASTTDVRRAMGDPMRVRPAVAIYGGTETAPVGTVFTSTNDGVMHAINMQTGAELWSFIPPEFLARQGALFVDGASPTRTYGLDGDVRIFKYDVNGNGIIETGDKMYALFGFGRGGSYYYALDVTSQTSPTFLWKKDAASPATTDTLPKLGQAWSAPVITRVNVNSTLQTDPQKIVAIFGGGYDESQENYGYTTDGVGNAIYMIEVTTGNLLWTASVTGTTGANFTHDRMNNSIPSDIAVLDLDGDSYADRMYAGDMGGRVWRFDIWHGQAPATLVSGGLFATLGAGELTTPAAAANRPANRRFYYAPDVSVVTPRGSAPFLNIAIGSGYRGHPLEIDTQDRFYSLRDYQPFNRRTSASYASPWRPIVDTTASATVTNGLIDVTTDVTTAVADGSNGWKLELNIDGWRGEKVLAESITANGVIFFPTFTPNGADPENPCLPATLNRSYAVYMDSGKPFGLRANPIAGGDPLVDSPEDRFINLAQGGIAPGTALVQTPEGRTLCLEGVEALGRCVDIGDVVRTYWERQ